MPTILLIRHGETVWNRELRVQGHGDSPLTPKGIAQARAYGSKIREMLGDAHGWRVVSSPLGRCVQTTGILAEVAGLRFDAVTFDERLREVHAGSFSGRPRADLAAVHPDIWDGKGEAYWVFRTPGGESYTDVAIRVKAWWDSLAPGDTVIAVSHGIAGKVLRGQILGLSPDAAMAEDSPQTALFRVSPGVVERVEC
ncbi:putative phosphoglycerate mutase GpmB [Candidatus Terasakiella magnetica]|nr:putative phosphoglycerate mutase GpmB [Candidatus Terasakiella magnetica]